MSAELTITEIFHSIQGESSWAGTPCTFVRLARCHLRCVWCDTEYSFHGGDKMTIEAIVAEVERADLPIVEVTGGEPLLQKNVYPLMERLLERGRPVLLETSGAVTIADVPEGVCRIVDMKAPGSGEVEKNHYENLALLKRGDELKIVLADREDYEWTLRLLAEHEVDPKVPIIFSPVHGALDAEELAGWLVADRPANARLGLQLHKFIWDPAARGV